MYNMETIPLIRLVRLLNQFLGEEWNILTKDEKVVWILRYRKAETKINKQIEKHGSVEAWYESSQGRLI